jgi:hypothetical protein
MASRLASTHSKTRLGICFSSLCALASIGAATSCGNDSAKSPDVTPPSQSVTPHHLEDHWIRLSTLRPDLHDAVRTLARTAIANGLVPVLYCSTGYTVASAELQRLRKDPLMVDAFDGAFVIQVELSFDEKWPYASAANSQWHSFHVVNASGDITDDTLDPGTKDGPCSDGDAIACAKWIRPFIQTAIRTQKQGLAR